MIRIGFTGVPGAGKTTLARAFAAQCRDYEGLRNVELVQEYARRYIAKHGAITSLYEQYRILNKQLEWENSVCNNKLELMITDSPIFLSFVYCISLPRANSKEVMFFNDIFKKMTELNSPIPRYDAVFHLRPSPTPIDDGIRHSEHLNQEWSNNADLLIQAVLQIFKPKYFYEIASDSLEDRISFCIDKIKTIKGS